MQRLEVSAVRPLCGSLGVIGLIFRGFLVLFSDANDGWLNCPVNMM